MQQINKIQITDKLYQNIQDRTIKINTTKVDLIRLWFEQGCDLIEVQNEYSCTEEELNKIFSISKGSIYNYIKLAKDIRIKEILYNPHQVGKESDKRLDRFNQKQLLRLTSLDDIEFTTAIEKGKLPPIPSEKVEDMKLSLEEQIEHKQQQIKKLNNEIIELKKNMEDDIIIDVDIADNHELIKYAKIEESSKQFIKKRVSQIDISTGETLSTFESLREASDTTSFSQSSISKCCSGKQKQAHGFVWKYIT
ncbi:MAG: NUMOD1 domain-containing DNA-binding protein [Campylobacterota bacterium]|nr:NUMOD1 domain-containing DNA-binding protein [Campylobacterota bacterium]